MSIAFVVLNLEEGSNRPGSRNSPNGIGLIAALSLQSYSRTIPFNRITLKIGDEIFCIPFTSCYISFYSARNTPGTNGAWSSKGCVTLPTVNKDFLDCECSHLTNFAIILDTSQTGDNRVELKIITWIGCGLSIIGLALTLATYTIFRQDLRSIGLVNIQSTGDTRHGILEMRGKDYFQLHFYNISVIQFRTTNIMHQGHEV